MKGNESDRWTDLYQSARYCLLGTSFRRAGGECREQGEVRCSEASGKFRVISEVASRTFACERQLVSASQHLELEQLLLRLVDNSKLSLQTTHCATTAPNTHTKNSSSTTPPKCLAITPISSCVARPAASPSAASAINATANAPSATPTCDLLLLCASATSAPSATTRTSASCAAVKESQTPSTASSARDWKRTETGAPRL